MGLFTPDDQAQHNRNARPLRSEEEILAESRRLAYTRLPDLANTVASNLAEQARREFARGRRLQPDKVYISDRFGLSGFQSVDETDVQDAVARRLNELSGFQPTWKVTFWHGNAYEEIDAGISISPVAGTF